MLRSLKSASFGSENRIHFSARCASHLCAGKARHEGRALLAERRGCDQHSVFFVVFVSPNSLVFCLVSVVQPTLPVEVVTDLLRAVERTPIITPTGAVQVTVSAGIAIRGPEDTFEKLYGDADEALYEAKRSGRSQLKLSGQARQAALSGEAAGRMNLILKL